MASEDHHTSVIHQTYGPRAPHYDTSAFHRALALDFVHWASPWLITGASVLDLACGTGLVTLPAKRRAGPNATVIGVDLVEGMLDVARGKSAEEGLEIEWVCADIGALEKVPQVVGKKDGFDVLFCCSAFVLLRDREAALRAWRGLVSESGVLVFDVPAAGTQWVSKTVGRIFEEAGRRPLFSHGWVTGEEAVRELVEGCGYQVERLFTTETVYEMREWKVQEGGRVFDELVKHPLFGTSESKEQGHEQEEERFLAKARAQFIAEFERRVDGEGVVRDEYYFHIVIAKAH